MIVHGSCLCGGVKIAAEAKNHDVAVCHCSMCARWSGGISMFLEVEGTPDFEGADNIGVYKSSQWGERGFCKVCGSSLFWRLAGKERYTLSTGVLEDTSGLNLALEIYIDAKPDYYAFANETTKQTGDEAMAAFNAGGDLT
jgi:hypothetical protein